MVFLFFKINLNFRLPPAPLPSQGAPPSPPPPLPSTSPRLAPTAPPLSPPQNIFQTVAPSAPLLSPPPPYSFPRRTTNANTTRATWFGEAALEKSEQGLVIEIDDILEDVPSPLTLKLEDEILNVLDDAENVLQNDYVSDRMLNGNRIEEIKEEYNFDDIKNEFDEGHVPPSLEFLMVVKMNIFV